MKVIIASNNAHKIVEIKAILSPLGITCVSLEELGWTEDIEETGQTFVENATLKAETIMKHYQQPVIADDSGLEIEALNGFPGVTSARFLGKNTTYAEKNQTILTMLNNQVNRKAAFVCAIAYAHPHQQSHVFIGNLHGEIAFESRGSHGFGYDPIFYLPKQQVTLAQLPLATKNKISHRAQALIQLQDYFLSRTI